MTKLIKYLNLIILLLAASAAYAETTNCTAITSIPYTISSSGVYCLTGNLSMGRTTGRAIYIGADDVVLDLNGWTLEGTGGLATQTTGIKAYKRKNITIRNGTIRGFFKAVYLEGLKSQGHLIEDIQADGNTYAGLWIQGSNNIVRRNRVVNTGGSTIDDQAVGIFFYGHGGRVLNNDINSLVATSIGGAYGIFFSYVYGTVVEGNRIDDVSSSGIGKGIGVSTVFSDDVLIVGNRITKSDSGIDFYFSTGKYRDNLTSNVTTPYNGGTDAGNND